MINLASKILDSRQPESMSYDNASGPIAVFARGLGLHSAVGTPIVVDGRIWGAMFACWTRRREIASQTMDRLIPDHRAGRRRHRERRQPKRSYRITCPCRRGR